MVSFHAQRGGRSSDQSNQGLTTTDLGMNGALSIPFGAPSWSLKWYPYSASFHCGCPSIARAYGSSSSLYRLQRFPSAGLYGPCTRKPYRWPGAMPGAYPCQVKPVTSGSSTRVSFPASSNRHSSTFSASSEKREKLVPAPSNVAPSGYLRPGWSFIHYRVWSIRGPRDPGFAGGAAVSRRPVRGLFVCLGRGSTRAQRQPQPRTGARAVAPVLERQRSLVQLRDLAAQREPDAGPLRLGGEEGDEEVRSVRDARPFVEHRHLDVGGSRAPGHGHAAARLQRGVHRVAHQVDEELVELVGVRLDADLGPGRDADREALLQRRDPPHPFLHLDLPQPRRRQPRQPRVAGHEARERLGPPLDHLEPGSHVLPPPVVRRGRPQGLLHALRDGVDGRQRVVDLVPEH